MFSKASELISLNFNPLTKPNQCSTQFFKTHLDIPRFFFFQSLSFFSLEVPIIPSLGLTRYKCSQTQIWFITKGYNSGNKLDGRDTRGKCRGERHEASRSCVYFSPLISTYSSTWEVLNPLASLSKYYFSINSQATSPPSSLPLPN